MTLNCGARVTAGRRQVERVPAGEQGCGGGHVCQQGGTTRQGILNRTPHAASPTTSVPLSLTGLMGEWVWMAAYAGLFMVAIRGQ